MPLPCVREHACVLCTVLSEDYLQSAEAEFCSLVISISQILLVSLPFCFVEKQSNTGQHKLRASLVYFALQISGGSER